MKTKNVLREAPREAKPTIGTHTFVMWPVVVEVIRGEERQPNGEVRA